jgi:hypothetical protein
VSSRTDHWDRPEISAVIAEPDLAAMLAEFDERPLDAAGKYAWKPAATGQLAVSEEECRDVLWATLDGACGQRPTSRRP